MTPLIIYGPLQDALASGGSSTILAQDNKTYAVYEVVGLKDGPIAAGTLHPA